MSYDYNIQMIKKIGSFYHFLKRSKIWTMQFLYIKSQQSYHKYLILQ